MRSDFFEDVLVEKPQDRVAEVSDRKTEQKRENNADDLAEPRRDRGGIDDQIRTQGDDRVDSPGDQPDFASL